MVENNKTINCHLNDIDYSACLNGFTLVNDDIADSVLNFHKSMPGYAPTPLVNLSCLTNHLGVKGILIKDESKRFDLNAFKVLGASYAMARILSKELNFNTHQFTFKDILLNREKINHFTFVTATDGNHGRAVAWVASQFGCKAVVYMPKGSSKARLEAIHALGAEASILDCNYDEAVEFAQKTAEENSWMLLQDTSFPGYEEIPENIMQGYSTLLTEAMSQDKEGEFTHVVVQAGVGALAAGILSSLCNLFKKQKPVFILVEASGAPCFYKSVKIGDGKPHTVHGDLKTIMAGLACGKPSNIAWEILKAGAEAFISCSDEVAEKGMRVLGNPLGEDTRIVSGESGAVTLGFVYLLLNDKKYENMKNDLKINADSKILFFSTEGDTDPRHYREVVW